MDMNKVKLIYSQKYNQFFEPMRMDEDIGTIYIKPVKNRHDGITKNQILYMEETSGMKFVVMHNAKITAEEQFLVVMGSGENDKAMMREIKNFKRNMLPESDRAMKKLKEISETEHTVSKSAKAVYNRLVHRQTLKENRSTYIGQVIPDETRRLAWKKRLFIERSDDYCGGSKKHKSNDDERNTIQGRYPCGFLIRDKGGIVVSGGKYEMSVQDVVDFVQLYKYIEGKHYGKLYCPPLDKEQKKQLKRCTRILEKNNLHYLSENHSYFWVANSEKQIIAGNKCGFNLKELVRFCKRLHRKSVTDRIQTSNS